MKITQVTGTINIDAADIVGTLAGYSTFQQTDSHLIWAGSWATRPHTLGLRWKLQAGAHERGQGHHQLHRTEPQALRHQSQDHGQGEDHPRHESRRLRRPLQRDHPLQAGVWTSPFLTPGNHTLKLEWTGLHRAGVTGTYVNLDAVQVIGGLR